MKMISHLTRKNYETDTFLLCLPLGIVCATLPVADPGLPRRGRQSLSLGQKAIIWQDFCRKRHENERNFTESGGVPGPSPLESRMITFPKITFVGDIAFVNRNRMA